MADRQAAEIADMDQGSFDFGPDDRLVALRHALLDAYGPQRDEYRHDPVSQFIAAMISARTKDGVSGQAFDNLQRRFQPWEALARSDDETVLALIRAVTYPEAKARNLIEAAQRLTREQGRMDFSHLAGKPVGEAMGALGRFKGIGPKSAAATLNFSSLRRRVFVIDTHVFRISRRIGLLAERVPDARAHSLLLERMPRAWDADDLYELHWLMKQLGQTLCTDADTPCGRCPLAGICETGRRTTARHRRNSRTAALQR